MGETRDVTPTQEIGRQRVVIERLTPSVDNGRYPIKRIVGDRVEVEIDAYADGHEAIACVLRYRKHGNELWSETPMRALANDRWGASFAVDEIGRYDYTAVAWVDD